jgi:hypothetical protein
VNTLAVLHRIALWIGIAAACASTHAEPGTIAAPRFEIDTLPQPTPRPVLSRWDGQRLGPLPDSMPLAGAAALGEGVRARWWLGQGRVAVGAGADWTASAQPTPFGAGAAGALRPRFALEFRAKAAAKDLRESLLRVQMSGDAALHFRPRGGGLQITYRERF